MDLDLQSRLWEAWVARQSRYKEMTNNGEPYSTLWDRPSRLGYEIASAGVPSEEQRAPRLDILEHHKPRMRRAMLLWLMEVEDEFLKRIERLQDAVTTHDRLVLRLRGEEELRKMELRSQRRSAGTRLGKQSTDR
jgi:hypothetical protein